MANAGKRPHHPSATCEAPDCQVRFTRIRKHQRFCSRACRYRDWDARHPRMVPWSGGATDAPDDPPRRSGTHLNDQAPSAGEE